MRKIFLLPGFLAVAIGLVGCSKEQATEPAEKKASENFLKRNANGEAVITLDDAAQARTGIKIEPLAAVQLAPEIKGFGRVVDPATLSAAIADLVSAEAAFAASGPEFERLKKLTGLGNTSERALQTAEAAARRDELLAQSARAKLMLNWGKAVAEHKDLAAFAKSLAVLETILVRVDLPAGQTLAALPGSVRIVGLSDETNLGEAGFFGIVPGVDPQTQSRGFLFLAKQSPQLVPNAAVTGYIKISGEPLSGVVVPRDAILRHDGKVWVYVQAGKDAFTRREIILERSQGSGWFVTSGAKANDKVVTVGAQQLLSGELKGQSSGE